MSCSDNALTGTKKAERAKKISESFLGCKNGRKCPWFQDMAFRKDSLGEDEHIIDIYIYTHQMHTVCIYIYMCVCENDIQYILLKSANTKSTPQRGIDRY